MRASPAVKVAAVATAAIAAVYVIGAVVFNLVLARHMTDQTDARLAARLSAAQYDPAAREVLVRGERPTLTGTELGILEILMRRSPGIADRRSIAQHVWDNEADAFGSNTIDVHLARLRSKLAGAGVRIETVRGVGYRITPL